MDPIPEKEFVQVKIVGFRSHARSKYKFMRYGANHIRGPNGAGKSDIYKAITWALYSAHGDKPHPVGSPKTTVKVTVKVGDIIVCRTCLTNTITVKYRKKTYRGEDAETVIETLFGSKRQWKLLCFLRDRTHPFVSATCQKRLIMLNEIVGNSEKIRKKIAELIKATATSAKEKQQDYDRQFHTYELKYEDMELDETAILSPEQCTELQKELAELMTQEDQIRKELDTVKSLNAQKAGIGISIEKYGNYCEEELTRLKQSRNAYLLYAPYKVIYDNTLKEVKKHFTGNVPLFKSEQLDEALIQERSYKDNSEVCKRLRVTYTEQAIAKEISSLEISLNYQDTLKQVQVYDKLANEVSQWKQQLGKDIPDAAEQIKRLEYNIKYSNAFELEDEYIQLEEDIAALQAQLQLDNLSPQNYVEHASFLVNNQWILESNNKYQTLLSKLPTSEQSPTERLAHNKQWLEDIERSRKAVPCPHCTKPVKITGSTLSKFDGVIVGGNVDQIKKEIGLLQDLAKLTLLPVPDGLVIVNVKQVKENISKTNQLLTMQRQLQALKTKLEQTPIPPDAEQISYKTGITRIAELKKHLETKQKLTALQTQLLKLTKPNVPEHVTIVNEKEAKATLESLRKVIYVDKPTVSIAAIKAAVAHYEACSSLPDKCAVVTEQSVMDYSNGLAILEVSKSSLAKIEHELAQIKTTSRALLIVTRKINRKKAQLEMSKKQVKMLHDNTLLNQACDVLDKSKQHLADLQEFKEIAERDSMTCISSTLLAIEGHVNAFLEKLDIGFRVLIMNEDKIKIHCIKDNGIDYGEVKELSDGEQSCICFGFAVAFSLISDNDLLILDEITCKLSPDNKDRCIELLLAIMKQNNKTLLLTDHTCHSGDYDRIIDLKGKIN